MYPWLSSPLFLFYSMSTTMCNSPKYYTGRMWIILNSPPVSVDHSRVKLTLTTSKNDADYINANFIKVCQQCTGTQRHIQLLLQYLPLLAHAKSQVCELSNQLLLITLTLGCVSVLREYQVLGHILRPRVLYPTLYWTSWGCFGSTE